MMLPIVEISTVLKSSANCATLQKKTTHLNLPIELSLCARSGVCAWCALIRGNAIQIVQVYVVPFCEQGQPPGCIYFFNGKQSPYLDHPNTADEAWYWPKYVLCSGWLCVIP